MSMEHLLHKTIVVQPKSGSPVFNCIVESISSTTMYVSSKTSNLEQLPLLFTDIESIKLEYPAQIWVGAQVRVDIYIDFARIGEKYLEGTVKSKKNNQLELEVTGKPTHTIPIAQVANIWLYLDDFDNVEKKE